MPIEEIDDYPEKMNEFELHWALVNAELGGSDFELAGGYTLANFSTDRTAVVTALSSQEGLDSNLDFARADRDETRADLRQQLILFRDTCKTVLPDSRYLRALPDTPDARAESQKFLDAWDDMVHIWTQINTDQPPEIAPALELRGGYTLAQFQTELATMRTRYEAVKAGERAAADGRGQRDELLDAAYDHMVEYRKRLPLVLEPDAPLVASMPTITPSPGSTPDAVVASGEWDVTLFVAVINWTASTDPNLERYEVRWSPGPVYSTEDEEFVFSQPAGGPLFVQTTQGLANEGDIASFKVYVVLTTGNEKGSNAVAIEKTTP